MKLDYCVFLQILRLYLFSIVFYLFNWINQMMCTLCPVRFTPSFRRSPSFHLPTRYTYVIYLRSVLSFLAVRLPAVITASSASTTTSKRVTTTASYMASLVIRKCYIRKLNLECRCFSQRDSFVAEAHFSFNFCCRHY